MLGSIHKLRELIRPRVDPAVRKNSSVDSSKIAVSPSDEMGPIRVEQNSSTMELDVATEAKVDQDSVEIISCPVNSEPSTESLDCSVESQIDPNDDIYQKHAEVSQLSLDIQGVLEDIPYESDMDRALSKSFDTAATALSESDEEKEKKIQWSAKPHEYHHFGYEQEAFIRVIVLLLDPTSRKFEFLHVELDTGKRLTVADTLKQLPKVSTNEVLSTLTYSVLCLNQTEFINILPLEHYNLIDGDILLAVPAGHDVKKVKKEARSFLQIRRIVKSVTRIKQRARL